MLNSIAFAGAGFSSAVIARELADSGRFKIDIFEERSHIAGNCYTQRDIESGIMLHQYGPHIFHTNREDVWDYVNKWDQFYPFVNRVKARTSQGVYSLPLNLLTINQFFKKTFNPREAEQFLQTLGQSNIQDPANFEEQALKMIGRDLYETFFYGYTKKQWGVEPTQLPASILKRLPIRFNYDDNYYNSRYQGLPKSGYTNIIERILDHPNIRVHLNQRIDANAKSDFDHLFYSGTIDGFFGFSEGRLRYRTLVFEKFIEHGDFQGNPVMNYCEESVPFTRITEHKHFSPWEEHENTVCFREYSKATEKDDVPYYPLRLKDDHSALNRYQELIQGEKKVTFIGRLGTYRYLDMHMVIGESLDLAKICLKQNIKDWPKQTGESFT